MAARAALGNGSRWAAFAALAGVVLSSCVGDVGDLFPGERQDVATAASSAEAAAASAAAAANDTAEAAGDVTPEPAGGEALPAAPLPLDDGSRPESAGSSASDTAAEPSSDGSTAAGAAPPPVEAPPIEAPLQPAPPATGEGPARAPGVCASVSDPLLLDFSSPGDSPDQAVFGDFEAVLSGGTYIYPQALGTGSGPGTGGLVSDVTAGDWHISGSVVEQSGFGLFLDCQLLDASSFAGIAFRISGNLQGAGRILFLVGTASNEVSAEWYLANDGTSVPSSGRCTPARSEYDGTCNTARIEIAVDARAREVFVPFSALSDGSPEPGVNPAEITTLAWALPSPATDRAGDVQPYAVDLRIDDIRFADAPAVE